jgi:hypothetical protein
MVGKSRSLSQVEESIQLRLTVMSSFFIRDDLAAVVHEPNNVKR